MCLVFTARNIQFLLYDYHNVIVFLVLAPPDVPIVVAGRLLEVQDPENMVPVVSYRQRPQ